MADRTATFEAGVNGNNITTGAGEAAATAWDFVGATTTLPTYDNAHAAHGTLSAKITAGAQLVWTTDGSLTEHYGRFYLYPTANQAGDIFIFDMGGLGNIQYLATGKLRINDAASHTLDTTATLVNNKWNRISYHVIHSATVGQIEIRLYTQADWAFPTETLTSPATWNTGTALGNLSHGCMPGYTPNPTYWLDTIAGAAWTWPGPLGLGGDYNIRA